MTAGYDVFRWVETAGGPLVVIPEELVGSWQGVDGSMESMDETDYERACNVADELGTVSLAGRRVLVLGDEPHRTSPLRLADCTLVLRWVFAENERVVRELVERHDWSRGIDDYVVEFETGPSGRCWMFDSADSGSRLWSEAVAIDLEPGRYTAQTGYVQPNRELRLLVHRLQRL